MAGKGGVNSSSSVLAFTRVSAGAGQPGCCLRLLAGLLQRGCCGFQGPNRGFPVDLEALRKGCCRPSVAIAE